MSDLDRWVWFAAVAEGLSFSRAARRLKVDQPWLARQILQLETQLGFALFARQTRHLALTREGQTLLPQAERLAQTADAAREAMRLLKRDLNKKVIFGFNPHTYWIPAQRQIVSRFNSTSPTGSLDLVTNYTPRLLKKLRGRIIDFALIPLPAPLGGLDSVVVHRTRPTILAPPEDPLSERASIKLEDLAGKKIVMVDPRLNPGVHARTNGPFIEAGAIPVISPEGHAALLHHAHQERLFIISAAWPHDPSVAPPGYRAVAVSSPLPPIEHGLVRRREELPDLAQAFWNIARECVPAA